MTRFTFKFASPADRLMVGELAIVNPGNPESTAGDPASRLVVLHSSAAVLCFVAALVPRWFSEVTGAEFLNETLRVSHMQRLVVFLEHCNMKG